jgi:hypothetical protein
MEHVFNMVQAIKNCIKEMAEGGSYLALSTRNIFSDQVTDSINSPPWVLLAALSEQYGFKVRRTLGHQPREKAGV